MGFKNVKGEARRKKITGALRFAQAKEKILEGFQCPHKRCVQIISLADYRSALDDHACGRCGESVSAFVPVMVDMRRIVAPSPERVLPGMKPGSG